MVKLGGDLEFIQLTLHGFGLRRDQLHSYLSHDAALDDVVGDENASEAAHADETVQPICTLNRLPFKLAPECSIHWNSHSKSSRKAEGSRSVQRRVFRCLSSALEGSFVRI